MNIRGRGRIFGVMKRIALPLIAALVTATAPAMADAACYADYKARRDNPLKLHYGVMELPSCDREAARDEVADRLAQNDWTLLNVLGVFDETGLEERKEDAGQYYLRF